MFVCFFLFFLLHFLELLGNKVKWSSSAALYQFIYFFIFLLFSALPCFCRLQLCPRHINSFKAIALKLPIMYIHTYKENSITNQLIKNLASHDWELYVVWPDCHCWIWWEWWYNIITVTWSTMGIVQGGSQQFGGASSYQVWDLKLEFLIYFLSSF